MWKKLIVYWIIALVWYCFFAYHYTKRYWPIIIYSELLLDKVSVINGFDKSKAKAATLTPPFVALRYEDHKMNDVWIRHEQIHHLQQSETLFLSVIIGQFEKLYAKHVLKKSIMQAYLRESTEQEAYLNQTNSDYIKNRKPYAFLRYMNEKIEFELVDHKVVLK